MDYHLVFLYSIVNVLSKIHRTLRNKKVSYLDTFAKADINKNSDKIVF